MSEPIRAPYSVPILDVVAAAEAGELASLGLPDVRDSILDTTFAGPDHPLLTLHDAYDVRVGRAYDRPWEIGELVVGTVTVSPNYMTRRMSAIATGIVSSNDSFVQDITLARFDLGELGNYSQENIDRISWLGLRRIIADFRIEKCPPNASHRGAYEATLYNVFAVEQSFTGENEEHVHGEPVLVAGTVTDYAPGNPNPPELASPTIEITTDDGRSLIMDLRAYHELVYGSSTTLLGREQTLTPPHPLPGDQVQIAGHFMRSSYLYKNDRIIPRNLASAHLLVSSGERISVDFQNQMDIDLLIGTLPAYGPNKARELIADFIGAALDEHQGKALSALADKHRIRLKEALLAANPHEAPETLLPVALTLDKNQALPLVKQFGATVLALTGEEFTEFALQIARGERETKDLEVGKVIQNYLHYHTQRSGDFTVATLTSFYDRFLYARGIEGDNQDRDAYATMMVKRALESVTKIEDTGEITTPLARLTIEAFGDNPPLPAVRQVAFEALLSVIAKCGIWHENDNDVLIRHPRLITEASEVQLPNYPDAFAELSMLIPTLLNTMEYANSLGTYTNMGGDTIEPYARSIAQLRLLFGKVKAAHNQDSQF